ncbi:MAG: nuclear transport factor 2 family protein [Acidobacteriaceae bacterium]|nr:nuclear transport factor 2 family protein [Acidobacteriaceae bacterium]
MLSGVLVTASLLAVGVLQLLNLRWSGRLGAPVIIASLTGKPELKAGAGLGSAAAPPLATDKQHPLPFDVQQTSVVVVTGAAAQPPSRGNSHGFNELRPLTRDGSSGSGASAAEGTTNSIVAPPAPDLDASLMAPGAPLDSYLNAMPTEPAARSIPAKPRSVISRDENAVVAALQRYSEAWTGRDVSEILAARPALSRRTVREELASTRAITMNIRPTSTPTIRGDVATVVCEHRVTQTFRDGVQKQSPGVRMTYVLQRQGGAWVIVDAH